MAFRIRSVVTRRRRCSSRSWRIWQRWHSAFRFRSRLLVGSWSRCAAASTTLVVRIVMSSPTRRASRDKARPRPLRQVRSSSSHHRPSPKCRISRPCGLPHLSHRPLARLKPDHRRKLRPVDRIKPFVLGADRHRTFLERHDFAPIRQTRLVRDSRQRRCCLP
jgi:hypothetical protein